MQHSEFVHLHVHSEYSLLDGAAQLEKLVAKAKELRFPAIALTDHGNLFGASAARRTAATRAPTTSRSSCAIARDTGTSSSSCPGRFWRGSITSRAWIGNSSPDTRMGCSSSPGA